MATRWTNPGEMNQEIELQAITRVRDTGGGHTKAPSTLATAWANVEPLQGREQLVAMQTGMTRPHRFTIPYVSGVTGATIVRHDGRSFDVKSVIDPEAAHRELVILADETV